MIRLLSTFAAAFFILFSTAVPAQAQSFRTETIDNGNGFTARESFGTSTPAATGYDAYATWDADRLFFGYTGQDVGDPACDPNEDPTCPVYEQGQSIDKYVLYYLDTDPLADAEGTTQAKAFGTQSWTLPFKADYLVQIRTTGETSQEGFYTGEAFLIGWDGSAWTDTIAVGSGPQDPTNELIIGDNNTSKYIEFSLDRAALGSPDFLATASWFINTASDSEQSYAYWPENAVEGLPEDGAAKAENAAVGHYYGFVLVESQTPSASNGQANRDRPFVPGLTATPLNNGVPAQGTFAGTSLPFHSTSLTNSNDFSGNEVFQTSTLESADTGYNAYATWDDTNLSFGYTGSDIGGGDCSVLTVESCNVFELGQSPAKHIVYYLDTDPTGISGTTMADSLGNQSWTLPFLADYQVVVRTDGTTIEGDYTGVADVKAWNGSDWVSQGPVDNLEIFDNSSSGFLKFTLDKDAIGNPEFVKVVSWFTNTEDFSATSADDRTSYAYWPAQAPAAGEADTTGSTRGATVLEDYYGFRLQDAVGPNASNGLANLNRPFFEASTCPDFPGDPGDSPGTSRPFHSIPINGSNSFNSTNEQFATSTTAATGYAAYATWDANRLFLGSTGSDVGGGDCSDPSSPGCDFFELGQSNDKWLVYFIDTDPTGPDGTTTAYVPSDTIATDQSWTLPFKADYALYVRSDGSSRDVFPYTGVSELKRYTGSAWESLGPCALEIFDNNTSGFLEIGVDFSDIGNPVNVKIAGWYLDATADSAYAYWPEETPAAFADASRGTTGGATTLDTYWGFELANGIIPNAPGNKNRSFLEGPDDQITFNTYTVNGERDDNEQLPQEYLGRESASSPALYTTWDADNLYLSFANNPLVGTNADLYLAFDTDLALSDDPRDGNGRTTSPDVGPAGTSPNQPTYPFAADVAFRLAGAAQSDGGAQSPAPGEQYTATGSGWTENSMPSDVQILRQEVGPTEVAIPWSAFDSLSTADSSYFHLVVYLDDSGNGIDAQWPTANPQGQNPTLDSFFSYYLQEGVEIFSNAYRSLRTTQGSTLARGLYSNVYLVVPNPGQNSATWSLGANTTVVNELYIGQSAVLNVGDNSDNPSGHNQIRFGRRFTGIGDFLEKESKVFSFDPAVGFSEEDQQVGSFATPSFTSKVVCDVTFYDLLLRNDTESLPCPSGETASVNETAPSSSDPGPSYAGSPPHVPGPYVPSSWRTPSLPADALASPSGEAEPSTVRNGPSASMPPATSSITVNGNIDLSGGSFDTGGNTFTLGENATVSGRESGNMITGAITRLVQSTDPTTLSYPVGSNSTRPLELTVKQLVDKPTAYTVEEIREAAPERDLQPGLEQVSEVRYYVAEKTRVDGPGAGVPLKWASITLPYGADHGLDSPPNAFGVARTKPKLPLYWSLGGTLVPGSDENGGAVQSRHFLWLGRTNLFALAETDASPWPFATTTQATQFEATPTRNAVALSWQAPNGPPPEQFEVQRTADTTAAFETVEAVAEPRPASGNQRYRFEDTTLPYDAETLTYRLKLTDEAGNVTYSPNVTVTIAPPEEFALHGNFPNPVRGTSTTIRYELPEAEHVRLVVYDALGREVAVPIDEQQPAGRKNLQFDARHLASGVYFYRLTAGDFSETKKLMVVR